MRALVICRYALWPLTGVQSDAGRIIEMVRRISALDDLLIASSDVETLRDLVSGVTTETIKDARSRLGLR